LGDLVGLLGSLSDKGNAPPKTPIKVETLVPSFPGNDVKRLKLTYGPFKLKAANSAQKEGNSDSLDPQGTGWRYLASDFPTNITILSAKMTITLPDGELISNSNGVYNHHAFIFDASKSSRSNIQCEGSGKIIPALNSISGSAADAGTARPKAASSVRPVTGNFIDKDHDILLTGDLVNYNNETKEVYMISDLQYVEGKATGLLETTFHLIPAGACEGGKSSSPGPLGGVSVKPPKDQKKFAIKGGGIEIKEDGKILVIRGHMHGRFCTRKLSHTPYCWF
jgi:hypothetical protein